MIYVNKYNTFDRFIVASNGICYITVDPRLTNNHLTLFNGDFYCSSEFFSERSVLIEAWEFKLLKDLLSEK